LDEAANAASAEFPVAVLICFPVVSEVWVAAVMTCLVLVIRWLVFIVFNCVDLVVFIESEWLLAA
jgi:hypothetical protein